VCAFAALVVAGAFALSGCETTGGDASSQLDLLAYLRPHRESSRHGFCQELELEAQTKPGANIHEPAPFVERRVGPGARSATHVSVPVPIQWPTPAAVPLPLVSAARDKDRRSFALRPLVAVESSPGKKRVEALWPIVSYRRDQDDRTLMVRPLFWYKRRVRGGGVRREVDTDWCLFPFLWGGNDVREGKYFAVFPLCGVMKGQIGKKKITFALFPLWYSTVDARYRSFGIAWPLIAYWRGKDQAGRRLFPFFGVNRREGRFDRRFWLWPFFSSWKTGLDTKLPGKARFVFPLYGRVTTEKRDKDGELKPFRDQATFLWPLFSYLKVADRNLEEIHTPWPFIGLERADGLSVRKLWPIYGERKSNDRRDKFVFWPLYRRSIWHEEEMEHRWYNVALIFTHRLYRWVDRDDGYTLPPAWPESIKPIPDPRIAAGKHTPWRTGEPGSEVHTRRWVLLWPLFHYKRDEDKYVRFQFLSLFTHRSRAAETLYGPFYTLYRYERDETKQKRESFLFGLFRHFRRPEGQEAPGMRYVNLAGIISYHRRTGISREFSILGGLYGYERVGDRRRYRFLWIPFGRIPQEVRDEYERKATGQGADSRGAGERSSQ